MRVADDYHVNRWIGEWANTQRRSLEAFCRKISSNSIKLKYLSNQFVASKVFLILNVFVLHWARFICLPSSSDRTTIIIVVVFRFWLGFCWLIASLSEGCNDGRQADGRKSEVQCEAIEVPTGEFGQHFGLLRLRDVSFRGQHLRTRSNTNNNIKFTRLWQMGDKLCQMKRGVTGGLAFMLVWLALGMPCKCSERALNCSKR